MESMPELSRSRRALVWEAWGVRGTAILTFVMGFINLISAVQPALQNRLMIIEKIFPLEIRHGSRVTSALAGFALFLLAINLWRRKRTAWIITLLLLIVTFIAHLIKGLDVEEASFTLGVIVLMALLRHSFHAISDRPSMRQGVVVLVTAFIFTLLYGTLGFDLLNNHFKPNFGILDAMRQTVVMFTSFYNPGLEPISGFGKYFAGSIYIIGLGTLGFSLLMLIRPVLIRQPATKEERERAEQIVRLYGRTSLARATLFNDKSYYFGPGDTVISYAARGRGVMVLGDPIGLNNQISAALRSFTDFCNHNDWIPSYVSILPDHAAAYKENGFDLLCIGYEAIVNLDNFSLDGSENKDIRYAVNKMKRLGCYAEIFTPPLNRKLVDGLHEISNAWLTQKRGGEMHFSDGWFDVEYIRNGAVIVVYAPDGKPTAFANLVPEYQKSEMTLDLMRHLRDIPAGTMEFMFAQVLQWSKEQGIETFSLGLSAVVGVGEQPDDPRVEQALHKISEYVSRFYNFKGLHNFKDNFHPTWEPRYLAYRGAGNLPLVLNTLLAVHSGGNFLWKFLKK